MTQLIDSIFEIALTYDAIIFDQWGVLHNGSTPYPYAIETLRRLKSNGQRMAVLSNSGKRSEPNLQRITDMGFEPGLFEIIMTSGEALWQDIYSERLIVSSLYPIARAPSDAESWANGLSVKFKPIEEADAILLMGLPDVSDVKDFDNVLSIALERRIPLLCSNPDRAAPRARGATVISPGTLAHQFASKGGQVQFYGKPYAAVFKAVEISLGLKPSGFLMVGDSLEHDIAGGRSAGWHTAFVQAGLHHNAFLSENIMQDLERLADNENAPLPDFTLEFLR